MTTDEVMVGLDEQIAKAEATLREVTWTAEKLRLTLMELHVLKSSMKLVAAVRGVQEVATT